MGQSYSNLICENINKLFFCDYVTNMLNNTNKSMYVTAEPVRQTKMSSINVNLLKNIIDSTKEKITELEKELADTKTENNILRKRICEYKEYLKNIVSTCD